MSASLQTESIALEEIFEPLGIFGSPPIRTMSPFFQVNSISSSESPIEGGCGVSTAKHLLIGLPSNFSLPIANLNIFTSCKNDIGGGEPRVAQRGLMSLHRILTSDQLENRKVSNPPGCLFNYDLCKHQQISARDRPISK